MIYPVLQWHLTNKCNFRCTHCYQENYNNTDLDWQHLMIILNQYIDWLKFNSKKYNQKIVGKIKITGGEPFVRNDIFDLLNEINKYSSFLRFEILTNGSLINNDVAYKLKQLSPLRVQISLDGNEEQNDLIRGKGSFIKIIDGIKNLVNNNIYTEISFTAHKKNYKHFSDVVVIGKQLNVNSIWTDRLIPINNDLEIMSMEEAKEYLKIVSDERLKSIIENNKTEVRSYRALQFINSDEEIYKCKAGYFITILPNGDFYPCRRLPIKIGNIFDKHMIDLYENDALMQQLRSNCNSECSSCNFYKYCNGGLRCLNYAVKGNLHCKDVHCWIK